MGALPELDRRPLRFGVFELHPASGELRKHGVRVRLQEQPLKVLLALIERPGEVCTREELIRKIWAEGTFVDYERGLNVAITRLRQVLGDSADAPRYIETLGRKGYRFVAPVERSPAPESVPPSESQEREEVATVPKRERWPLYAAAGALVLLAIVAAAGWQRALRTESQPFLRLNIDLGPGMTTGGYGPNSVIALSRDGTRVAVSVKGADGKTRLATRRLDESRLTLLPGTEGGIGVGAASPFFSPDGKWIAFFAQGKLKKIAVNGGEPITLCDADTHAAGPGSMYYPTGSWGNDGNIVAALNVAAGLSRIPGAGGTPVLLRFKQEHGEVYRWPQVLPGNEAVLFTVSRGDYESGNIEVYSMRTGERKVVEAGGVLGRYLPSGHLVFLRQNVMQAAPFDLKALKATGEPQAILEDMGSKFEGWNYDYADNGSFVYVSLPQDIRTGIFWLDRAGSVAPLQAEPGFYAGPRFSPDGTHLAFSMSGRSAQGIFVQDIWAEDLASGIISRLTSVPGKNESPIWTVDGRNIVFRSVGQPNLGIYTVHADGGGDVRKLADLSTGAFPSSLSQERLAAWDFTTGGAVWTFPLEKGTDGLQLGKAGLFLQPSASPPILARADPAFSPDGRWIAYSSLESGQIEVYVRPFPGPGGKRRISATGGTHPTFSRKGNELFYLDRRTKRLMVVSYQIRGDSFNATEPVAWSPKPVLDLGELYPYDVTPDGKRVAVVLYPNGTAEQSSTTSLTLLLNFFGELQRRVPSSRN